MSYNNFRESFEGVISGGNDKIDKYLEVLSVLYKLKNSPEFEPSLIENRIKSIEDEVKRINLDIDYSKNFIKIISESL